MALANLPHDSIDYRDALLAWAIVQLGGSVVIDLLEQDEIFHNDWEMRTFKDDRGRLIVEARKQ